ncbi:MAG: hypothetical protein HYW50_02495 [Candidatus Diapherotrites archaeon]|nr:hypothetical protein [Candidatus Diapherotrites archaeon]
MNSIPKKNFAVFFILAVFISGCSKTPAPSANNHGEYHAHADFLVHLGGERVDFAKEEYMSTPYMELNPFMDMHDLNPNVLHVHDEDGKLSDFFQSIGMEFSKECFELGEKKFCNNENETLQFFVNGKPNQEFENYKPKDLDKILIYFGEGAPSQEIFETISNQACIYSEKCAAPEGFVVPDENCSASRPCVLPE